MWWDREVEDVPTNIKPEAVGWPAQSLAREIDDYDGPGGHDGFVTLEEIRARRESLEARRDEYARTHSADSMWDAYTLQVRGVLELEQSIRSAEQWMDDVQIQYLPDTLANLDLHLRKRATEILLYDGAERDGFSQTTLQHAHDRLLGMPDAIKALVEVTAIAKALGLPASRGR